MRVDVLYFGILKDLFGGERDLVELADGATVAALLAALKGRSPRADGVWQSLAIAVNRDYAQPDTHLADGDEVALLPPVSGGSHAR